MSWLQNNVKCTHAHVYTVHTHTHTHTYTTQHSPSQHMTHQKNSLATRLKAAGSSSLASSGIAFKREVARWANDRRPAAVLVVGGRRCRSCLVGRSHVLASAKVLKSEARSSGSPRTRTLCATIAVWASHIWRGERRPRWSRAPDT